MSQINANFQELISNNNNNNNQSNSLDNVPGTTIISSETLQGFSMANQFAICANSGNGPVLLSCLTPMLLPTLAGTSKNNFEITGGDGRGQNQPQTVQIQLASPFNLAGNICNAGNAQSLQSLQSLGLSYINLSSLTNAGAAFPLQITLNNTSNNNGTHQITIPTATLNTLNQEVQIAQNYQIGSQIKFEPELNVTGGQHHHQQQQNQQQQQQHQQQQTIVNHIQDISDNDDKTKRKPRRRIPNKSNKYLTATNGNENNNANTINTDERLLDHKGRPFIYNCPNCPKKFTLNSRLTAHLRCHTGIRPYTCGQCGFSFTQKSYLIRHAAVHTEERPFTCERCLKTYKHYGSLANHRKLHRKEDKNGGQVSGVATSEISDSEQKPLVQQSQTCDTTTKAAIVDQTNYDNLLQLHADWSTVASSMGGGSTVNDNTTTTYLIANNNTTSVTDNSNAYFTDSSLVNVNVSHCLSGTGPVAFPDQQLTHSLDSVSGSGNQSMTMDCVQQQQSQGFCASSNNGNSNQSTTVYMDLQLISSTPSQQQVSTHHQALMNSDNIHYTHVELSTDPQHQQTQSQQLSSSSMVLAQQQQHTYTTTFTTTNTV